MKYNYPNVLIYNDTNECRRKPVHTYVIDTSCSASDDDSTSSYEKVQFSLVNAIPSVSPTPAPSIVGQVVKFSVVQVKYIGLFSVLLLVISFLFMVVFYLP